MKSLFKIGYFADGPWAYSALEKILSDNSLIVKFIVPRIDSSDEILKNYCLEYNIPYLKGIKINSDEFYSLAKESNCDLFVSMSYNQIFKNRIINLPQQKTINCHAGKLPFYRGRNVINWALINDEKEIGITVHYVDEGIDTGDIILQKVYPISDSDTYQTLLNLAYKECAEVLYEAIKLIQLGKAPRINQSDIHPVGFYCGTRGIGDEIINWNQNSRLLFNFIRAICLPGPVARTYFNGTEIKINSAKMIANAPIYIGKPGQIIGKSISGYIVKTLDSSIEINDVEFNGNLKIGDVLGK